MPGFKRKNIKRKGGKRRAPRRKLALSATRSLNPLPSKYICKLKYVQPFDIDPVTQQHNFNLNSLFDPDRTGLGHQPYGFDQLSTLYEKYRVISASWVINGINTGDSQRAVRIAACPHNDNFTFPDMNLAMESPRTKYIIQGAQGSDLKTLKGWVNMNSVVGRTKPQYMADDKYGSSFTASPSELVILTVMGSDLDNSGSVAISCTITLEFTAEFYDVRQQNQS